LNINEIDKIKSICFLYENSIKVLKKKYEILDRDDNLELHDSLINHLKKQ